MPLTRRKFLQAGLAAGLAPAVLAACGRPAGTGDAAQTITMVSWGGTTQTGLQQAVAAPFQKVSGIPVRVTAPVDYGKYLAQIKSGNLTWDWVDIEGWFAVAHKDDWDLLPASLTANASGLVQLPRGPKAGEPWGVENGSYSFAIAYRTDHEGPHPKSWREFFDPGAIPGKRSIYNYPYGMLEVALLADGVPFESLYPLDVDRAIKKLDSVRSSLVFWNSGAELQQQLQSGAAPFAFAWNNRVAELAQQGQPVAIEWAQNLQDLSYDVIPKVSTKKANLTKLLEFRLKPENQLPYALATGYSPPTTAAMAQIPAAKAQWFNAYPPNLRQAAGSIDLDWWATNFDDATKKWDAWASA
jgi:putative spermidine/putrescine transport system substrate-binding protein